MEDANHDKFGFVIAIDDAVRSGPDLAISLGQSERIATDTWKSGGGIDLSPNVFDIVFGLFLAVFDFGIIGNIQKIGLGARPQYDLKHSGIFRP